MPLLCLVSLYSDALSMLLVCADLVFLTIIAPVFLCSYLFPPHLQIFQTSALLLPVMTEVRCAARTKRATSSVTVLQAGREPAVRKVLSSLALCAAAQQRLNLCTVIQWHVMRLWVAVIGVTLVWTASLFTATLNDV